MIKHAGTDRNGKMTLISRSIAIAAIRTKEMPNRERNGADMYKHWTIVKFLSVNRRRISSNLFRS
jgi:hypothetical protein